MEGGQVRRRPGLDLNHRAIVSGLRAAGCSVLDLSSVGGGCPDILVGARGRDHLLEIKHLTNGKLTPGAKKSAVGQKEWHDRWRGHPVRVVYSLHEALNAVGIRTAPPKGE